MSVWAHGGTAGLASAPQQLPESCFCVQSIVGFEEVAYSEKENVMDDNAMRAGVSLLGDLATQVPPFACSPPLLAVS